MSYVGEIADHFKSHCGKTTVLDPMDYMIIAEWEKQGIPLGVVVSTIDEIFDRLDDDSKVDSVGYFQDRVKQKFRAWLEAQA